MKSMIKEFIMFAQPTLQLYVKILEALRCRKSSPGSTEVGSENVRKVSSSAVDSVVVPPQKPMCQFFLFSWGKNFKGNGPVPSVPVGSILHFGGSNVENEEALEGFHGIFWSLANALWLSVIKFPCSHELDNWIFHRPVSPRRSPPPRKQSWRAW